MDENIRTYTVSELSTVEEADQTSLFGEGTSTASTQADANIGAAANAAEDLFDKVAEQEDAKVVFCTCDYCGENITSAYHRLHIRAEVLDDNGEVTVEDNYTKDMCDFCFQTHPTL